MTYRARLLAVVVAVLTSFAALAQTTGSITGRVTDESGSGQPGVTVEARGPALQGARAVQTDTNGVYKLSLLPPGAYRVVFNLPGFAPVVRNEITVGLGKETTLDQVYRSAGQEEIKVVGTAPPVDTTSATIGTNITKVAITALPTDRNYASIVQIAPGVSTDASEDNNGGKQEQTITVYGSSGAENSYFIDGVNTTGVEYGFQGTRLNYEFIQEVDVKTGGYEAEYGKSTGGIINVITKSGGNQFSGDVFTYYDNDSLQRSPEPTYTTAGQVQGFTKQDFGADLGGYFVKDKLWFFAAYNKVKNTADNILPAGPDAGQTVESKRDQDLAAVKLTYNINDGRRLVATYFQDPRTDTGAISDSTHSLNGVPSTYLGEQKRGGRDYGLRYEAVYGADWIVMAQVARHTEENSVGPSTADGDTIQYRDVSLDSYQTGGFGLIQDKNFTRDFIGLSMERLWSRHQVKLGIEYESEEATVTKRNSGGQQVDVYANPVEGGPTIYKHNYWTTPDATVDNAPVSQLNATPKHHNTTIYLQDKWSIRPNLTLSAGVRWDRQEIIDSSGKKQIDLKDDFAPRLGLAWDPGDDHLTKVYASYGHFYEQIPMDLVIRSYSYERQPRIINYDPVSVTPDAQAEADLETPSTILGGFEEPADPKLRGQYIAEYILGAERQVSSDVAVGAKLIYRDYKRVIEDFLCRDDGTYCVGNPGTGIMSQIFTLDYSQQFPAPEAKRTYKALQLDVNKRFSHNWQAMASYVYSKLDGNYDGEYAPFTNIGADPNISAAYDYYDFFTNGTDLSRITNNGPLSNDRRHQFKLSGVYVTPFQLSIGLTSYYSTGTPLSKMGFSDAYGRYEFFLNDRGSEGRTPDIYEADLHLGYPITFKKVTANILLDVFNLLNRQRAVLLDQRWSFQESDNASPEPTNPNYGKPVVRTGPTGVRLGLRVSF